MGRYRHRDRLYIWAGSICIYTPVQTPHEVAANCIYLQLQVIRVQLLLVLQLSFNWHPEQQQQHQPHHRQLAGNAGSRSRSFASTVPIVPRPRTQERADPSEGEQSTSVRDRLGAHPPGS
ncbi:unnamed protein product [Pylaiella littoralis]